ncbi:MAG: hypothetical protein K8R74_12990, partial [Bacteroidales bacterium]|nr:hypothetical protein [Bacteroidales bacterium]
MIKNIVNILWERRVNYIYKKKLNRIIENVGQVSSNIGVESEYKTKWSGLIKNASVFYPRVFAAINGISSADYVPENVYYNKI